MAVSTIPSTQPAEPTEPPGNGAIPPLENGDRLTRDEFERRYDAMPDLKKAELIEGEVYMPSPVRHGRHSHPHTRLVTWLGNYETDTPGVEAGDNGSIRLDLDNEPQPDGFLIIRPEHGGQVRISEDDYIEGAPNSSRRSPPAASATTWGRSSTPIAATACASTSSGGCSIARSTGIVNREGRFELVPPPADGILRSEVFPGLWLDPAALVRGDGTAVQAVLQQGLNSPEHAEFVARLERDRTA